jgi:hypothetical protein
MFADDHGDTYPLSGAVIPWNGTDPDTPGNSWMQQISPYVLNTNVYHCPANVMLRVSDQSAYNYFNGVRAAYVAASNNFAAIRGSQIQYTSALVLSGDTLDNTLDAGDPYFYSYDADKDDYSQNCVGGDTNGTPSIAWQVHKKGQDILFTDSHVKWYNGYTPSDMTFRYDSMQSWME